SSPEKSLAPIKQNARAIGRYRIHELETQCWQIGLQQKRTGPELIVDGTLREQELAAYRWSFCLCLRFTRCPRQPVHRFRSTKSRPWKASSNSVSSLRSPSKAPLRNGTQA